MTRYITPYSATVAVAVASVMSGLGWGILAIPAAAAYFFASRYCLGLMVGKHRDDAPYNKTAEQIAVAGMLVFLLMIFSVGVVAGLLVFVIFAQLALNLQTFGKSQIYLGLVLSFTLITFSASESRDGFFILYFIPYSLFLCATFFGLNVEEMDLRLSLWLKSSALLLVCTFMVYMLMPRFPALLLGATPGSDHYYHNDGWLDKAERQVQEGGQSPGGEKGSDKQGDLQQSLENLKKSLEAATQKGGREQSSKEQQQPDNNNSSMGIDNSQRLNNKIIMQVRSDKPLYLTTKILDTFDGLRWSQSDTLVRYIEKKEGRFIRDVAQTDAEGAIKTRYEVEMIADLPARVPLAWQPTALNFPATALKRDAYGSFQAPGVIRKGTAYSAAMQARWHNGRLVYPRRENHLAPYLAVPNDIDPRIKELAGEVMQQGSSWQQAVLLEKHLRNHYEYTLDTAIEYQGRTPLAEFLFKTRYGHCEFFASAMALMLRTQGIPSRVVNGFAASDQNPLTGFIEVRGTDAHAWVEAYHEGYGWVPYEPTAYYQLPQKQRDQELTYAKVNEYVERQLEILEEQEEEQSIKEMALKTWQAIATVVSIIALGIKWLLMEYGAWIAAFIMLLVLLWVLYRHFKPQIQAWLLKKRVERYKPKGTVDDYAFYIRAIEKSLKLQGKKHRFSTVGDFTALLQSQGVVLEESDAFVQAFNRHVYGQEGKEIESHDCSWLKATFDKLWSAEQAQA